MVTDDAAILDQFHGLSIAFAGLSERSGDTTTDSALMLRTTAMTETTTTTIAAARWKVKRLASGLVLGHVFMVIGIIQSGPSHS